MFQYSSGVSFNILIHISGINMLNLYEKPMPPSAIVRHNVGIPDTSSATVMASGLIYLMSEFASIK